MNWKQITLTAIVTLLVTILSGIIVSWYTKSQLEQKLETEKLVYDIRKISDFKSDSLKLCLFTAEVINIGEQKANDVQVIIEFSKDSKIIDENGLFERTNETIEPIQSNRNKIVYKLNNLYPLDKFVVNVALDNLISSPSISVQSSESIGLPYILDNNVEKDNQLTKAILIIFLSILLLFPTLYVMTRLLIKIKGYPIDLNNTAFLFIHNNQIDLAIKLLTQKINTNGGGSHELANLALAKCLNGKASEEYYPLIRMAEFISNSKRNKLVIHFNFFIIAAYKKDYLKAKEEFELAAKIDKKEFKKYLNYSLVISEIAEKDLKVKELIEQEKEKYFA